MHRIFNLIKIPLVIRLILFFPTLSWVDLNIITQYRRGNEKRVLAVVIDRWVDFHFPRD